MVGRKPTVSYDTVYNVLLALPVFDCKPNPVKKDDPVWDEALRILNYAITKKNLHQRFFGNRLNLQTNLKNQKYPQISRVTNSASENLKVIAPRNNTLNGLNKLMADVSMKPIIKNFWPKPFRVIYTLPDQLSLYKEFIRKCDSKIILNVYEGLVDKTYINERESESLFFFTLVGTVNNNHLLSFFQAITEKADRRFMSFFCGEILKQKGVSVPRQCYTNGSLNNLEGISVMLNHQNLEDYSIKCFQFLNWSSKEDLKKQELQLPVCTLHLDINKTMQYIGLLMDSTMCNEDECVKEFYFDCILHLCHLEEFEAFTRTVNLIFTLLYNRYFNRQTEIARESIVADITSHTFANMKKEYSKYKEKFELDISEFVDAAKDEQYKNNEIYIFFKKMQLHISTNEHTNPTRPDVFPIMDLDTTKDILSKENNVDSETTCDNFCQDNDVGSSQDLELNPYKKLGFLSSLTKFLTIFPLWTSLIPFKKVNFISYNEAHNKYYGDLCTSIYDQKIKQPVPADEFLRIHIQSLIQEVEKGRTIMKTLKSNSSENNDVSKNNPESVSKDIVEDGNDLALICENEKVPDNFSQNITYPFLGYCGNWKNKASNKTKNENEEPEEDIDQTSLKFEQELSYFKNMLDQSIVETDHDYCRNKILIKNELPKGNVKDDIFSENKVTSKSSTKKPAEYLNPCPHLDLMYNRTNASGYKDPIIQNGNLKPPRSNNKIMYKLESTSAFDAIVEVLQQSIKNYQQFHDFCVNVTKQDNVNDSFLKIVLMYVQEANVRKFNTSRFHYLLKEGIVAGGRIFCDDDLVNFFNKLMAQKFVITKVRICSGCHSVKECTNHSLVNIPTSMIMKSSDPQKILEKEIILEVETDEKCVTCQHRIVESFDAQDYLAIYVNNDSVGIENIQENIIIKGKLFTLAGLIERVPKKIPEGQTHFVAYCRFIKGNWQKRDNTMNNTMKVNCQKKIDLGLIIYVQIPVNKTEE